MPQVLFQIGETSYVEKKYDEAIAAWETLAAKFPGTEPAATPSSPSPRLENEKGDPAAAIERFKQGQGRALAGQAAQRVAVMEAKALTVVTPRTFRSGEAPHLKITTRNLEKLTFTAYKLDPEAYFRKKHALGRGVAGHRPGRARRRVDRRGAGYAKYRPIETTYELKKWRCRASRS